MNKCSPRAWDIICRKAFASSLILKYYGCYKCTVNKKLIRWCQKHTDLIFANYFDVSMEELYKLSNEEIHADYYDSTKVFKNC